MFLIVILLVFLGKHLNGSLDICLDEINCVGEMNGTLLGDPKDCNGYFVCAGKQLYGFECQSGEMFDVIKRGCMDPRRSQHCQDRCEDSSYERFVVHKPNEKPPYIPTTPTLLPSHGTTLTKETFTSDRSSHESVPSELNFISPLVTHTNPSRYSDFSSLQNSHGRSEFSAEVKTSTITFDVNHSYGYDQFATITKDASGDMTAINEADKSSPTSSMASPPVLINLSLTTLTSSPSSTSSTQPSSSSSLSASPPSSSSSSPEPQSLPSQSSSSSSLSSSLSSSSSSSKPRGNDGPHTTLAPSITQAEFASGGFTTNPDTWKSNGTVTSDGRRFCEEETSGGVIWPRTKSGDEAFVKCPLTEKGSLVRRCSDSWEKVQAADCLNKMITEIQNKLNVSKLVHANESESFWREISAIFDYIAGNLPIGGANSSHYEMLLEVINEVVAKMKVSKPTNPAGIALSILNITGSILSGEDGAMPKLFEREDGATISRVLSNVETLGMMLARMGQTMTFQPPGMIMTVMATKGIENKNIEFPVERFKPIDFISMLMSKESFQESQEIFLSFTLYKHLKDFLPITNNRTINSSIISIAAEGTTENITIQLLTNPVKFYYEALQSKGDDEYKGYCSFWDMKSNQWSQDGCQLVMTTGDGDSYCQCHHLTNFALLMSLEPADEFNNNILSIISIVGCIISIVAMVVTLIIFAINWRNIKSHHLVVIINLCIALIIANVTFLAGVNRTDSKAGCVVVAALLHYFYLAAFFMMLAEGIELLFYIVFLFHVKRRRELVALITFAWICPLIIVVITLGVTKATGYTSKNSCWLNLDYGVIWAFVGPVLLIILANLIILSVVVIRIVRAKKPVERDTTRHRLKSALWGILILTPVLGLTWVFGILSVSRELIVFQYIFAVVNSLQGLFIFLFHGLRNKKGGLKYKQHSASSSSNPTTRKVTDRPNYRPNQAERTASHSTVSTTIGSKSSTISSSSSSGVQNVAFQKSTGEKGKKEEDIVLVDVCERADTKRSSLRRSVGCAKFFNSISSA